MPSRFARLLILAALVAGCAGVGTAAPAATPSTDPVGVVPAKPSVALTLAAADAGQLIGDAGTYAWDPTAALDTCQETADGYWRVQYAGGEPWVGVDLLVGPSALTDGSSKDVTAEIQVGSPLTTYLWIDQPGHRGGDAPGRSTAAVEATEGAGAVTFEFTATTPIRTTGGDLSRVDVDLTVVCPTTG